MLDVAVLVPFQNWPSSWIDPGVRASLAASKLVAIRARDRFFEYLGRPGATPRNASTHRSLTAVVLATSLERAGVDWRVLDPGAVTLGEWRARLEKLRPERPRLVAISSTFVNDGFWLATLCELVRRVLPEARVAVGGYYYASDAKQFLSLDADVFCIGEGDVRIVSITEAVRDGRPLDAIPGLYLRDAAGALRYTGEVEPLSLDTVPRPDWSLSPRIDPPIDARREAIHFAVETQRGCVFKCEFCTFRTLAAPVLASVERGVSAIRDAASYGDGVISVVDATATYPRDRFRTLITELIRQGGSSLPISIWARVTDLDEDVCALMAKAGVRQVQIGMESGDQRMLNAMRKGTRVADLAPAIHALGRHRVAAHTSFVYGFPGESHESLATTRRVIATMNDGHEQWPVVRGVSLSLFDALDFAGVRQRDVLQESRRFDWNHLEITPPEAAEQVMKTHLELSRIPHAPSSGFGVVATRSHHFEHTPGDGDGLEFFRFAKAVDRGVGLFVEQELEGKRPDSKELSRLRDFLLPRWREPRGKRRPLDALWVRARHRATWQVMKEWPTERDRGVGPLTRLALAWEVGRATGRPRDILDAARNGAYPRLGYSKQGSKGTPSTAAEQLIRIGIATGRRRLSGAR